MSEASPSKIKNRELLDAIRVLNRLKRRIDGETKDHITHGGKWFLHNERAALITKTAMRRLEAIELVSDCIVQWYALLQATKPNPQPKSQNGKAK